MSQEKAHVSDATAVARLRQDPLSDQFFYLKGTRAVKAPLPPGPRDGFFSRVKEMRTDFLGYLSRSARDHGDVVRLKMVPGVAVTLVNHPEHIEDVLVKRAGLFVKSASTRRMVGKFLGNGLVTSEGEENARQRKLIRPVLHSQRLQGYGAVMVDYTRQLVDGWAAGQVVDVDSEMTRLALRIVARTLFDADATGTTSQVGHALRALERAVQERFLTIPFPDWVPTGPNRRQAAAVRQIQHVLRELVAARRQAPGEDLLSLLLQARYEDGQPMPEQLVLDEAVTLFFAGHETSAHLLSWTLWLLASHPESEVKLRAEVAQVAGERALTVEDAPRLVEVDRVLKEALRLYPPSWVFDRAPVEDVELGGYRIPKGNAIYISPWVTHRDPRWFPDPEQFLPGRWEAGSEPQQRFTYIPFGVGRRMCIGQAFALLESRLVLATLLQRVRLALPEGTQVRPEPSATLKPRGGLPLRVDQVLIQP